MCLPYSGEFTSQKLFRQLKRLLGKVAPSVELRLVFKAAQKLSCLSKLKAGYNLLSNSGVVYKISCLDCDAFYVGKTKRRLEQRVQEHSQQDCSALKKHTMDFAHSVDYQNPQILATDSSDYRLSIKESIKISDLKANFSLNANVRSVELMLW